jgi:hypothetical protein
MLMTRGKYTRPQRDHHPASQIGVRLESVRLLRKGCPGRKGK